MGFHLVPVFGDATISQSRNIEVSGDLIRLVIVVVLIFLIYFFSFQVQQSLAKIMKKFRKKIGIYSTSKEYYLQRYVYQHSGSPITKLYKWINEQIIALGLKRQGVTPFGYFLFWAFMAILVGSLLSYIMSMGVFLTVIFWVLCLVCMLIMTRVMVSERLEKREADIMNAVDLIVPEIGNGVKNAIVAYKDNFAPSVREDFAAFLINIQDRGYTFEDAMYILSDNLGSIFQDFAQKAIYFEAAGEKEMVDIFTDITETNRLRRQLRDENNAAFTSLRSSFIISVIMVVGYFIFLMITDEFSRHFFLQVTAGKFLLIGMVMLVFMVLAYIATIKSKQI